MLSLEYEFHPGGFVGVRDHKRVVLVQVSHVGIEPELCRIEQLAGHAPIEGDDETRRLCTQLRELQSAGKSILLGIDEVERLKGLTLKLLAFEHLLHTVPERRGGLVLVQVGVRARNFTPAVQHDFDELRDEVIEIISRIDAAYPGAVQFVEVPTISLAQRMQVSLP